MSLFVSRRIMIAGAAASAAGLAAPAIFRPVLAQGLEPTLSMRGGANNYRPGAPIVERIGKGGFWMTGTVRRAGDGAPIRDARIQIWAHTTEGYENDPQSHGATLTDANGAFQMDMPQIVPAFGQPHGHLAYDAEFDGASFKTVFLRPVMSSASNTSLEAHFVLSEA
ncbi:twin-arginine translocation pathway signal [Meridianimarinicoccus sp. RP-17]|uniref:twin-arginine translocation pathway signal n=1 Tax=Meridianimarinicoccus zhengii TaxID=2056810 RepID=UPI000DAC779B|nr:twin-arginine translocation pathway signal [Phycocomes zhengii]